MYEVSFAKLSEMYFRGTTWPPVQYISSLVDDDSVFCLLYKVWSETTVPASDQAKGTAPFWMSIQAVVQALPSCMGLDVSDTLSNK